MAEISKSTNEIEIIYSRKAEPLDDVRRSSCGEGDVGHLCSSVFKTVDRQSKDLGSNPSAVESVFFSQKDFEFFKFDKNHIINKNFPNLRYKKVK